MSSIKFLALLTIAAVATSVPLDYGSGSQQGGMPYSFDWTVNEPSYGNNYGHKESSDGNVVQGIYYVLLPDSRIQTVKYRADDISGFVADVQYEGEPVFGGGQKSQGYN